MKKTFILSVTAHSALRALQRIVCLLTRSRIDVDRLTMAEADAAGVSRLEICLRVEPQIAERTAKQLRRVVEISDVHIPPL